MSDLHEPRNVLVTGGCGFIGCAFVRRLLGAYPNLQLVNLDALVYSGRRENLADCEEAFPERYRFVLGDVADGTLLKALFHKHEFDTVVHFAAESHVDRSIDSPRQFVRSNIVGTFELLEAARGVWGGSGEGRFHHVSTDEVFGSAAAGEVFSPLTRYDPSSPYSASKAASDHLVRAWARTYGLNVTISNCTNNFGPFQYPEKLIPLVVSRALQELPVPVYGDGQNEREWLYVDDHADAVDRILRCGSSGETYFVGSGEVWTNLSLVRRLLAALDELSPRARGSYLDLITFVRDRPGHDRRYAMDSSATRERLQWKPKVSIQEGLEKTVNWYVINREWVRAVTSGTYELQRLGESHV
jgi:dTDP-glucose 4,6-dehydratase